MTAKKSAILAVLFLTIMIVPAVSVPAMPPVSRAVLANNLVVLVFEDHSMPAVTLELLVGAGSWRDSKETRGVANLTAKAMLVGTKHLSFDEINDKLDFLGATLDADCTKDYSSMSMQMLKKDLDNGFSLFMDLLTAPAFPEGDVAREKDNIVGKLRSLEDQPAEVAMRAFDKALFLGSAYAYPVEGTEDSLEGIGPADLQKFYNAFYRPNNSILVIGGDITADEVQTRLVPGLLKWQAAEVPPMKFIPEFAEGSVTVKIDKPVTQATIIMGNPGIARGDKDYYKLAVMNQILGSGELDSRLMAEIRVKAGLAYGVQSSVAARKFAGAFRVMIQTKNPTAKESIDLAVRELGKMQKEPVSDAELQEAKKFMIGNFPLRYAATQQEYAKFRSQIEFYGLGLDYPEKYPGIINAVTANDVREVAQKYLKPDKYVLSVVADLEKAGMK